MAELIPALSSCIHRMQSGEKRFAERLQSHLENDYTCWYEIPLGTRQRYSDFIVLHPGRGLLLLEVKDWKIDTLQRIDRNSATLITSHGLKTVPNPLEQVRPCAYSLVNQLERDPQLTHPSGRYQGKLIFPYGFGVVLSNITRQQFESTDLGEVIPAKTTICKDEMAPGVDAEQFQQRMWDMFNSYFSHQLTLPQIDRIRWHLFPEVRIQQGKTGDLFSAEHQPATETLIPNLVKVMDKQQEQLARSLGDGHRVIHGVAGSGKTLILGYRCLHLAKLLKKPILVLCYNITLAARLRELVAEQGVADQVQVYHFHDWCSEQLRLYHIPKPAPGADYPSKLVATVIDAAQQGRIPKAQYGAVMIDEGHDFEADWLKLIVSMVDPETNSFLLLYDDAQSIYSKQGNLDFSLSSVGIQARGRTKILKINYRNTREIIDFAYGFASHYLEQTENNDQIPIIAPESVGRHGAEPVVKNFPDLNAEINYITRVVKSLNEKKHINWSDICILYRSNKASQALERCLKQQAIPIQVLSTSQNKKTFSQSDNSIKMMSMHSSKGLEFPVVIIFGLGYLPVKGAEKTAEAKLLYVGMTRATEKLLLTSHQASEFCDVLNRQLSHKENPEQCAT